MWLVKANPPASALEIGFSGIFSLRYGKGQSVAAGDQAFLWLNETSGGHGLAGSGQITNFVIKDDRAQVTLNISRIVLGTGLTIGDLAAHRDDSSDPLMHKLARLYRSSNTQIIALDQDEMQFLESCL